MRKRVRKKGYKSEIPGPTNQFQLGQTLPKPHLKTRREFEKRDEEIEEERVRMREEGYKSEMPSYANQLNLDQTLPKPHLEIEREFERETERRD